MINTILILVGAINITLAVFAGTGRQKAALLLIGAALIVEGHVLVW